MKKERETEKEKVEEEIKVVSGIDVLTNNQVNHAFHLILLHSSVRPMSYATHTQHPTSHISHRLTSSHRSLRRFYWDISLDFDPLDLHDFHDFHDFMLSCSQISIFTIP